MFCPQCGKENEAEARFCGHCGGALGEPKPGPGSDVRQGPVEPVRVINPVRVITPGEPVEPVAPALKWGVLAASFLMPLVGIGMGLYYWLRAESADKVAVGKLWLFGAVAIVIFYGLLADL